MKKLCAATLAALATTAALTTATGTASAATVTADLFAYRLPTQSGAGCTIGVTNLGPDTVGVQLYSLNPFLHVYNAYLGELKSGESAVHNYAADCKNIVQWQPEFVLAAGSSPAGDVVDPLPVNNYVLFDPIQGTPPAGTVPPAKFGSS